MSVSPHTPAPDAGAGPTVHRLAVAGLGRAGIAHAMAIARHDGCALTGFAEPRAELRRFAKGAGFTAPSEPSLAKLLAKAPCDALVVCAPVEVRAQVAAEALAAGLEVLVDGLPTRSLAEAAPLAALPADVRARLRCATPSPFHPLLRRGAALLASGALGTPRTMRASAFVSRVFAPGAPPARLDVLDFAVGDLLVLLDRTLGPARAVKAAAQRLYGERPDEVHATLALESGAEVGLDASWSVPGYPRAAVVLEVEGERGTLIASDDALEVTLEDEAEGWAAGTTRVLPAELPDPLPFDAGECTRPLHAFVDGLRGGGRDDELSGERALRALATLDAMRRAFAHDGFEECRP
ncbi:MAG: Gfo/Idh/MocA family oxidoreductase [Candidatus Eisenbacteria bacterium]